MRVVDINEMKEIERLAVTEYGFSESLIIENVGIRGADFVEKNILSEIEYEGEIVVLVGSGNNAADGLAIVRNLVNKGFRARAFILFPDDEKCSEEQQRQVKLARTYGVRINEVRNTNQIQSYFAETQDSYIVIDAVLGTGFKLPLSQYLFEIFNCVNVAEAITIAVDIPSGITANVGAKSSTAIEADFTLAIGLTKSGHYIDEGARHSGEVITLDVGFPRELLVGGDKSLLNAETITGVFGPRNKFAHKNTFGHALVLGGSPGLTGANIMASSAALKVGSGLVTAATWKSSYHELTSRMTPEVMTGLIPTKTEEVDDIMKELGRYDSVVIGPGLGTSEDARRAVLQVLNHFPGPVVVDADAIKVLNLEEDHDLLHSRKYPTIFTPHMGEFAQFTGASVDEVLQRPIDYLKEVVDRTNTTFIMKGPCSFLGFPNGDVFINYYPNDGMATGGSGDVLAGILGGLLAQNPLDRKQSGMFMDKSRLYQAVCLGVSAHTIAGKFAADKYGVRAMTAGSIVECLSDAFKKLHEEILL
jgi:NAD(P)H-hydrate epimerase